MAPPTKTATPTPTRTSEKKSLGRRKIEIKKLVHEGHKQVTFSKRRVGIFKKAAELAVLCDAQIAVVTFSPGDKCFCFGHPSVDSVADRFSSADRRAGAPATLPADFPELNREHAAASAVLEAERRREAELRAGGGGEYWWERAAGAMGAEELEVFVAALQEMKFNVERRIESAGKEVAAESGEREGYFGGEWEEGGGGGVFCNGFEPFWINNNNNGQPQPDNKSCGLE